MQCALGVALIIFGLLCPASSTRRSRLTEDESEGVSSGKAVRGELVVAGSVLSILALICLATTLAISLGRSRPYGPGAECTVVAVYAQPAPGGGSTSRLMADVRLAGDGTLRSVLVKGVYASPGQRGYIAWDGTLVVYAGRVYDYYGWYGWYGGGWAALFFILFVCSLVSLFACVPDPVPVRYVQVYAEQDKDRPVSPPKEKDEAGKM